MVATNKYKAELPFSPDNAILAQIVNETAKQLNISPGPAYANARALEKAVYGTGDSSYTSLTGIQFDDALSNITDFQQLEQLSFSLRFPSELRTSTTNIGLTWLTSKLFALIDLTGPRNPDDQDGGNPVGYLREGFLPVQNALSMAWLKLAKKQANIELPEVIMQRYPYPEYIFDPLLEGLASILPLIILLSFIYPCSFITKVSAIA